MMGYSWMTHSTLVDIPKLFWHPGLKLPRHTHYGEIEQTFEQERGAFLDAYARLLTEEETGRVANTTVIQVIASAWKLKKWETLNLNKDQVLKAMVETTVPELVRKYGMTRIWKAGYVDTLQRRVEEELGDDNGKSYRCARCGRALSAELSVKRGIGPVCIHKLGQPVHRG
jgi:hypothetical protein